MIKVERLIEEQSEVEESVKLNSCALGEVVRLAETNFDEALESGGFYIVTENPVKNSEGRVFLVPLDGKAPIVRDGDRPVIKHKVDLRVGQIFKTVTRPAGGKKK